MYTTAFQRGGLLGRTTGAAAVGGGATALVTSLTSWSGETVVSRTTTKFTSRAVEQWQSMSISSRNQSGRFFSSTSSTESNKKTFVQWYEGHLDAHPIRTKAVTGSILWGIGDVVAQVFPHLSDGSFDRLNYDWMRTGRAVTFGGVIHAPTSHLHFNFLEWMTVRSGLSGLQIPIFKTFMEQFVYWSWISNSMYHAAMGAMQGQGPQEIYDRIADLLMDMQKAQWAFWIPVQLVNFNFVPVRHQLNVVLLTSIVWTALLSMWYPPIEIKTPEVTKPE